VSEVRLRWRIEKGIPLFLSLVIAFFLASPLIARKDEPLKPNEILDLLHHDVPSPRVAELVKQMGVAFTLTPKIEDDLRKAGATQEVIEAIKAAQAPTPSEAPTPTGMLRIISKPGEAQVYVDNVPKGMTSPEGELRLPLPAGKCQLRVSLPGYESWENPVTLESGETQAVYVTLLPKTLAPQPARQGNNPPTSPTTAPAPGHLPVPGVKVGEILFFESGYDGVPYGKRQYTTRFPVQTTHYVNWEVHLSYPRATQQYNFALEAFWYGPNGNQVWHDVENAVVKEGWSASTHAEGWGCKAPPCNEFIPGTYRLVITYQSRELQSATFEFTR
jgi:PEGA domain